VKFQTHIPAAETLPDAPMPPFFRGEPRFQYFERTAFSREQLMALKERAEEKGAEFLSSPFSIEAVELLEEIGVRQYKVASGEVTNLPLLEAMARTGKHIILSSGMSSWEELDEAVETIVKHNDSLTVLQCTTAYPCPYERVGLNVMLEIRERYGVPVGLSDHTLTTYAAFAAVTLGASMIEKHFTFSRHMYGSDAKHSLEPGEFADMVQGIRAIEAMLGSPVDKSRVAQFKVMKDTFEKSIVSVMDISKGTVIERHMLGFKKPGTGIPTRALPDILGTKAARDIISGTLLSYEDLE
jgi:N,N'-diacetyllegionaminate synthase